MTKKEFLERWGKMACSDLGDYILKLEKCCKRSSESRAKAEAMWKWMTIWYDNESSQYLSYWFLKDHPEAKDWFNRDGSVK